jgi:glycosyltransferase involved in cell wall biosynthesis
LPHSGNPLLHFGTALPGLIWALPYLGIPRLASRSPDVREFPMASGTPVSLIIPARNEAATIDHLLDTVLRSGYQPLEVIVVDDRSTDDTAARVRARLSTDSRLQLVVGADLPAGWFGKPWACAQGAAVARGTVLIFTDADTSHHPDLIGHAVGVAADLYHVLGAARDAPDLGAPRLALSPREREPRHQATPGGGQRPVHCRDPGRL